MKNVHNLLNEVKGEKAHKQAVAMGLKYKGFGYWVDPATGEVAYKTENDQLVPVEPEVESEKAGPGAPDAAGAAPSGGMGNPEGMGGSFGTFMNKQLPLGTGTNVQGIADNGMAQAPNDDNGRWEPGPDGDNFINDQQKGAGMEIKKDAFVSGPNYYGWTAGPDGDNFQTMTIDQIMKKAFSINQGDYESEVALGEQIWDYLMEAQDPQFGSFEGRDTLINKLRQSQTVEPKPPELQQGTGEARAALAKLTTGARGKVLDSLGRTPHIQAPAYDGEYDPGEYTKALKAQQKIWQLPAKVQDRELVGRMNKNIQGLIADPNFNLKLRGDELGSGAFGSVYESPDGNTVIKEGEIGPHELAALFAMRDNPAFPSLINAKFDTPFLHQQAMERDQPILGRDTQFNPDDYSEDFEKRFPTARGTYAMTKMKGQPLADAIYSMTEEQQEQALNQIWRARAALHAAGFSHNDMHGGNIMVDDEGNASIMDLGLANDDPLSALMEALGGLNDGSTFGAPGDYQLSAAARLKNLPDDLQADLLSRRENIREMIMDNVPSDWDADEDERPFQMVEELLNGEIRSKTKDLDGIREMIPYLADKKNVKGLIKELYGKLLMSDQEGRMSDAFDKLQADSKKIRLANLLRRTRGEKDIEVKNPGVVPPKNLIFDDDD